MRTPQPAYPLSRLAQHLLPDDLRIYPLLAPERIRAQALRMQRWVQSGHGHFRVHENVLPSVIDDVLTTIKAHYPDLNVPFHSRWRHFSAGGVNRIAMLLEPHWRSMTPLARLRSAWDLAIVSVLLDAGAGAQWHYREDASGATFNRSLGLAVASVHMFVAGMFSSEPETDPLRVDAAGLLALTADRVAHGMQHREGNALLGFAGRFGLLHALGRAMQTQPQLFALENGGAGNMLRPGHLADVVLAHADDHVVSAADILLVIQVGLGPIWPGRHAIAGFALGDVWPYAPFAQGGGSSDGDADADNGRASGCDHMVPFHKLSQWLTYSLIEPMQRAQCTVRDVHRLTGLAEYRNGGLLLDSGLLTLVDTHDAQRTHAPSSPLIVEWRALTIHWLDRIATGIRQRLQMDETSLPMVKVLEGGTWQAGRQWADLRRNGLPPLTLASDGTVF